MTIHVRTAISRLTFGLLLLLYSDAMTHHGLRLEWVQRYNGPDDTLDIANAIAIDDSGYIYVTGQSGQDYSTIKYTFDGDALWVRRYGAVDAHSVVVDANNNVCVTGGTWGQFATIKYSPAGDSLWARAHPDSTTTSLANALAVDDSGYVYVTGGIDAICEFGCIGHGFTTIKYTPLGDTTWERRYSGGHGRGEGRALRVDDSGNVYVAGFSELADSTLAADFVTVKYSPMGDTLWSGWYNGSANANDIARALDLDGSGNVYVTGGSSGSGSSTDYATIKYTPSGDTLWVRRYNGPANGLDQARALILDGAGNAYVTGYSKSLGNAFALATLKYSPSGDTLWVRRLEGSADGTTLAHAMALDSDSRVFVSGEIDTTQNGATSDIVTVIYSSSGDSIAVLRYDGPANGRDFASAVAIDDSGNVFVTGASLGISGNLDYVTLKYTPCNILSGDVNVNGVITSADIIALVNYAFKSGPPPLPCPAAGDVNCDDNVTSADIIYLVNHVFKGGPEGCDVCHDSALVSDC